MEITDARHIEIFHTLDKIERMNKAISFHKALERPDTNAIEQYSQIKEQLTGQFIALLAEMDLKLQPSSSKGTIQIVKKKIPQSGRVSSGKSAPH